MKQIFKIKQNYADHRIKQKAFAGLELKAQTPKK